MAMTSGLIVSLPIFTSGLVLRAVPTRTSAAPATAASHTDDGNPSTYWEGADCRTQGCWKQGGTDMFLKRNVASRGRGVGLRGLAGPVALVVTAGLLGGFQVAAAGVAQAASATPVWSTQLDFDNNGSAWSESFFAGLAADGLTNAELDMPWGTIEPSAGTFTFTEFDTELANAAAAGIKLIPIFWQAGWGGSPAPWITDFEESSSGAAGAEPDWWNPTEQSEYFTYVQNTIKNAVAQPGGYGGAILDYGYLDAMWDLNGSGGGYTADDISEFQNTYLPQTYSTIAAFNTKYGTSYSSFSQVPAQASGQSLFGVFQAFRAWSVQQTYGTLTADVRAFTTTPLFYYFGGGFGNATNYSNNPDTFFELAKTYNVTIIDDDASSQGLTLTFGALARAYGVQLMQEWTAPPSNSQLGAEAVQWLSLYGIGLPNGGGEDFFIHDGTEKDIVGFPVYTAWLPTLRTLTGSYPQQPTAVYIDFSQAYGNTSGGSLNNVENQLASLWLDFQAGFTVVTSQEVANGAISLSQFKAILPLNGVDANLTAYRSGGGTVLTSEEQLTTYITPYADLDSSGILQTVPDVAGSHTSAQIALGDISSSLNYDDTVQFNPAGLGLNPGGYYLVNDATGAAVPQTVQSNGDVCATAAIGAASLAEWSMEAGSPPSGTASSGCPTNSGVGASSISTNASTNAAPLQFLGVGQTNSGADGNLTKITQSNQAAVETWTSSQSGAGDANLYLQNDPVSAVEAASTVTVQVTYWATAGQGFTVQYDSPGNAYLNGPTVTSPGTGTWTTASVQLTNAQFNELQNYGADLRLNVTNPGTALIVQSITMSTSGPTLTASPVTVAFGSQADGSTSAAQSVTIKNTGTAAASISSVSTAAPFSETNTCGSSLAVGASCTASVKFASTSAQAYSGTLTVASNATDGSLTVVLTGTGTGTSSEAPYGGTPAAVPGTVYAANYDTGGQGVAYNVTSVNGSANSYRSDGVDLEDTSDTSDDTGAGVYDLGWTATGQSFKYTVDVATAGTYTVGIHLASPAGVTDALHIDNSAGTDLSGLVNATDTGGWQDWGTVNATVTLPAGVQTLTVDQDNAGWNIHYLTFAQAGISTTTWYEVVNENSGLCATAASTANGTAVEQEPCTGATTQLWKFTPATTGYYEVLNDNAQSEGESWNIAGGVGATASGDLLQTWNYGGTGNTNALFGATLESGGYYNFIADNSGLCIDTPAASTTAGVQLQQYTCNGTGAQAFSLVG
jgi:Carbohydrate binding module (family 6)/Ricin-type beta-trefoil lectin domain-like/Beta-galactosidase